MNSQNGNIKLLIGLSVVAIALFVLDLAWGNFEVFQALYQEMDTPSEMLLWDIRLPRVVTAILVGAGLSIAGLTMQILFRNPLAGPSILGVNAGSSLMVALLLLTYSGTALISDWSFDFLGNLVLLFSIAGAVGVLLLIGVFSLWLKSNLSLLITGILFSYFSIAIVSMLQFFAKAEDLQQFVFWTFGSLDAQPWSNVFLLAVAVMIPSILLMRYASRMNVFLLGQDYAANLGIDISKMKWFLILTTAVITGVLTALTGPIGFVGLAVPHLARMLSGSQDTRKLLSLCFLIGVILMLLADIVSRTSDAIVLPINAITALLGSPIILIYIFKNRHKMLQF